MDSNDRTTFEHWAQSLTWGYDGEGYPIGLNTETRAQRAQRLGQDWRAQLGQAHPDDYCAEETQLAWLAWQAARRSLSEGALPAPPDLPAPDPISG